MKCGPLGSVTGGRTGAAATIGTEVLAADRAVLFGGAAIGVEAVVVAGATEGGWVTAEDVVDCVGLPTTPVAAPTVREVVEAWIGPSDDRRLVTDDTVAGVVVAAAEDELVGVDVLAVGFVVLSVTAAFFFFLLWPASDIGYASFAASSIVAFDQACLTSDLASAAVLAVSMRSRASSFPSKVIVAPFVSNKGQKLSNMYIFSLGWKSF